MVDGEAETYTVVDCEAEASTVVDYMAKMSAIVFKKCGEKLYIEGRNTTSYS